MMNTREHHIEDVTLTVPVLPHPPARDKAYHSVVTDYLLVCLFCLHTTPNRRLYKSRVCLAYLLL